MFKSNSRNNAFKNILNKHRFRLIRLTACTSKLYLWRFFFSVLLWFRRLRWGVVSYLFTWGAVWLNNGHGCFYSYTTVKLSKNNTIHLSLSVIVFCEIRNWSWNKNWINGPKEKSYFVKNYIVYLYLLIIIIYSSAYGACIYLSYNKWLSVLKLFD